MHSQRALIDEIRRDKFLIGSCTARPLAPDLHRSITHLSVEQYQNNMHFIKELIQNAEDNIYGENVCPSLEFLLTNEDVALMGVSSTLLVLNNEKGLKPSDVRALCSMENSTKKGKRDTGLIGCKGIGFKSVFMVCKTPIIISGGFRIRFQNEPCKEAGTGYIVPEWAESPADQAILSACGLEEVPTTVIVLPLRHDKVDLVRRQLREISPENILFLSKIRELRIVDRTNAGIDDESDRRGSLRITRSEPISVSELLCEEANMTSKFFKVTLTVKCDHVDLVAGIFCYLVCQSFFPVTRPIDSRKEVNAWGISLAFPVRGRTPFSQAGDVFSFLPTELRTGFPFLINADFILTSSRESIRFDLDWNIGILDLIPVVFQVAFSTMISQSNSGQNYLRDRRDAYKFLPVNPVQTSSRYCTIGSAEDERHLRQKIPVSPEGLNTQQMEKVRAEVFRVLEKDKDKFIFLSSPGTDNGLQVARDYGVPAKSCFQIKKSFREILESAAQSKNPSPSAVLRLEDSSGSFSRRFGIVDEHLQDNYSAALAALQVSDMTDATYETFLRDSAWLKNLPDDIYIGVLWFLLSELKLVDKCCWYSTQSPFFKVLGGNGEVELVSYSNLEGFEVLCIRSEEDTEWICKWVKAFATSRDHLKVLPPNTSQALLTGGDRGRELMIWMRENISLTECNVTQYAESDYEAEG